MPSQFEERLNRLQQPDGLTALRHIRRGLEKESLRIDKNGRLAMTPHPAGLGSPLTHPAITTDFAEALLELITPVATNIDQTLDYLTELHRFVYQQLGEENLWVASMPCVIPEDDRIPVAQYGTANVAKMKTAYRVGLGYRYGRSMQTIAGIHYNFSVADALWPILQSLDMDKRSQQDFITDNYFRLIRNFRRFAWLLIYLFGASPAVCKSFVANKPHQLEALDQGSCYLPYATSLRMGDLGYQSNAQNRLLICYNQLETYIETLLTAITESHPDYERFGTEHNGEYRQLSTALLQIENEFYSPVRPKRVTASGETPLHALHERGVEYIEVRCIDLNPFIPGGIDRDQIRFLDSFLLYCLMEKSRLCDDADTMRINQNIRSVVNRGREPGLMLRRARGEVLLTEWADELLDGIEQVAGLLDQAHGGEHYTRACATMRARVRQPALTPSAHVLESMQQQQQTFFEFAMAQSAQQGEYFRGQPPSAERSAYFRQAALQSLQNSRHWKRLTSRPLISISLTILPNTPLCWTDYC